jgi:hypothetical protein
MQRVTVLYIGGAPRSGGTVLGRILGGVPGFLYVGELQNLWFETIPDNEPCGCGQRFFACEFWSEVVKRLADNSGRLDIPGLVRLHRSAARERHAPTLALFGHVPGDFTHANLPRAYGAVTARLYREIAEVSGASVVVDSSRVLGRGFMLARLSEIDLKVIQLVRDARAVAFSSTRQKVQFDTTEGRKYLPWRRPLSSALSWTWLNFWCEKLCASRSGKPGSVRLRYEDLVAAPAESITRVLAALGLGASDLGFIQGRTLRLGVSHAVSANPVKFVVGEVELRLDDEWRTAMKARTRRLVTAVTWPLLRRYGYPLWRSW